MTARCSAKRALAGTHGAGHSALDSGRSAAIEVRAVRSSARSTVWRPRTQQPPNTLAHAELDNLGLKRNHCTMVVYKELQ